MSHDVLAGLPRHERKKLLDNERRRRKSGNWPAWETLDVPKGTFIGRKGWADKMKVCHRNQVFSVLQRDVGTAVHLAVSSLSQIRPSWYEMQRIKDEIAGPEKTAVEVYPPHDEIVDGADMFHIWVLPDKLTFGIFHEEHWI